LAASVFVDFPNLPGFFSIAFQEPKLEVPTIYKAYFSGLNFREYPSKIWPYMVQYLHFRILKFPLNLYPIDIMIFPAIKCYKLPLTVDFPWNPHNIY
jgi:hypothetical protein